MLTPEGVGALKFAIAACATALLIWERCGRRDRSQSRLRNALLLALGLTAAAGWWNFFQLRYQPGFGHPLDVYHYYVGAKYFDELGYTRLYECTTVADSESGAHELALRRSIRNLETYQRESASIILSAPDRCKRHFSGERWETFKHDVGWFRERVPEGLWQGALTDYGYNPTPAWGALAQLFMSRGPVSQANLAPVLLVDPLMLCVMWLFVWRAFGWRGTCVALVFWGTNLPGDYLWTGGAFLRQSWLVTFVIGICCLRTRWAFAGGFLLAISALLRVFPAAALAAITAAAALAMFRARSPRLPPEFQRIAAGSLAAVAIVVPLAFMTAGGPTAWLDFAGNIAFHARAPFATNVGLRSFLARTIESGQPILFASIALAYFALLLRAIDRKPAWVAAAVGAGAVVVLASMSNYYYGVLLGFGLLWTERESVGALLCGLAASGWCLAWLFPRTDDLYVWLSLATVLFVFAATAVLTRGEQPEAEAVGTG